MIIVIAIVEFRDKKTRIVIEMIRKNQMEIITSLSDKYSTKATNEGQNNYLISLSGNNLKSFILINNDVTLQRFNFGSQILFDVGESKIKPQGKEMLKNLFEIIIPKLDEIKEIQIQGHTDTLIVSTGSNLELGSERAISIFHYMLELGIDPTENLISATSYGEFKPFQRGFSPNYNRAQLNLDNNTPEKRELNRRIEIVLIYRGDDKLKLE